MVDTNVLSYFLIIICGFGAVWSFRLCSGRRNKEITEFEYAGFSTVWGSLIFLPILQTLGKKPDLLTAISTYPFIATPTLFVIGCGVGSIVAFVLIGLKTLWKHPPELKRLRSLQLFQKSLD